MIDLDVYYDMLYDRLLKSNMRMNNYLKIDTSIITIVSNNKVGQ